MDVASDLREPGRGIGRDIARAEVVETDLDNFITRRHNQRVASEGERQAEEVWQESERAHAAARAEENRLAWHEYHQGQAECHKANLARLVARHEAAAAGLMDNHSEAANG